MMVRKRLFQPTYIYTPLKWDGLCAADLLLEFAWAMLFEPHAQPRYSTVKYGQNVTEVKMNRTHCQEIGIVTMALLHGETYDMCYCSHENLRYSSTETKNKRNVRRAAPSFHLLVGLVPDDDAILSPSNSF